MIDFFFYGTLLDDDVRAIVLGPAGPATALVPATLAGYRRVPVAGHSFPVAIADPRGRVEGAVLAGVSSAAAARFSHFEGPEYDTIWRPVMLAGGGRRDAWVFVARPRTPFGPGLRPRPGVWSLALWQRRHKADYVRRLRPAMAGAPAAALAELGRAWVERERRTVKSDAPRR